MYLNHRANAGKSKAPLQKGTQNIYNILWQKDLSETTGTLRKHFNINKEGEGDINHGFGAMPNTGTVAQERLDAPLVGNLLRATGDVPPRLGGIKELI